MLTDLLPPALAQDPTAHPVALAAGAELAALQETAALVDVLGRIDELDRPHLDAVARYLGVDFYDPAASDAAVREIIAGAFTWHRRRGTPWALRWAFGVLGIEATVYEPPALRALAEAEGIRHFDGSWSWGDEAVFFGSYDIHAHRPRLTSWAEFLIEADLDGMGPEWGPQVERAVALSVPARSHPVFYLTAEIAVEADYTAALARARAALGDGYTYSGFPTLAGLSFDGTWTWAPTGIVARRTAPARTSRL